MAVKKNYDDLKGSIYHWLFCNFGSKSREKTGRLILIFYMLSPDRLSIARPKWLFSPNSSLQDEFYHRNIEHMQQELYLL